MDITLIRSVPQRRTKMRETEMKMRLELGCHPTSELSMLNKSESYQRFMFITDINPEDEATIVSSAADVFILDE